MSSFTLLLGRIFIAGIFLMSGINKVFNFAGTQEYMANAGMPMTGPLLVGAIVLEAFGGLSLILGWKTRWGALALILFLIPATLIFHFDLGNQDQMIHFMKNLAILGGLLFVSTSSPGLLSLDGRSRS